MTPAQTNPLETDHYRALGEMVVSFQHLEAAITHALLWITDPDWEKKTTRFLPKIIGELSYAARLRLLSNFLHTTTVANFVRDGSKYSETRAEEYPALVDELKIGIALAQKAEERRNQLIHSHWITGGSLAPAEGAIRFKQRIKADKDADQSEYVTAASIYSIVASMDEAAKLIAAASWRLGGDAVFNHFNKDDPLPASFSAGA